LWWFCWWCGVQTSLTAAGRIGAHRQGEVTDRGGCGVGQDELRASGARMDAFIKAQGVDIEDLIKDFEDARRQARRSGS